MKRDILYGVMAEFKSPFPIEELSDAVGFHKNGVPLVVLIAGIIGCLSGYALQYWISVIAYPINVGGRPMHSWPSFVVVTFEVTILFAGVSAVLGMLALNGLPMPYHPVFNVPRFALASKDRFFLIIFYSDPKFDLASTTQFLQAMGPRSISEVPG